MTIRVDKNGNGHYGSQRKDHTHAGTDYLAVVGEAVFAPIDGTLTVGYAYKKTKSLGAIAIKGKDYRTLMLYVKSSVASGEKVTAGQFIGTMQDVAGYYKNSVKNHLHLELKDASGKQLNPEQYFQED